MYILYFLISGFITYNLLYYYKTKTKTKTKIDKSEKSISQGFNNINSYSFLIKNVEFYKDNKLIEVKLNYNNIFLKETKLEINCNHDYDYLIINYIYNEKKYKYAISNNTINNESLTLTFPMYLPGNIKNYIYINKITKAILFINEKNSDISLEIDILEYILPFLGPNYNFYKDLDLKLDLKLVLKNVLLNYDNKILQDDKYLLKLYDTFNNNYDLKHDYLTWNPNLQL